MPALPVGEPGSGDRVRTGRSMSGRALAALAASACAAAITAVTVTSNSSRPVTPSAAAVIQHVVVIFQENVSFDHYFATYPHAENLPGETPFTPLPGHAGGRRVVG